MNNKLQVKHGTFDNYSALSSKDNDTLYFITDRGLVYKGSTLVSDRLHITINPANPTQGQEDQQTITITDYSTTTPSVYTVRSNAAINAIVNSITASIATHRTIGAGEIANGVADDVKYGHVVLFDEIDDTYTADSGFGYAATPKAVYDALADAKEYVDTQLGGLSGAMVFKGTIGDDGDNPTVTSLPTPHDGYEVGWTYRVISAGTYAGKVCEISDMIICVHKTTGSGTSVVNDDWTVAQNNIDGAVTAANTLTSDTIILGNGTKTVKTLAAGTTGYLLQQTANGPAWVALSLNGTFGLVHGTCSTAGTTSAKVVVWDKGRTHRFENGSIFSVLFANANKVANATIKLDDSSAVPIYWNGNAITADSNAWEGGNTVTFMYSTGGGGSSVAHIISVARSIDTAPTQNSTNAVTSGSVYTALAGKQPTLHQGNGILIETISGVDNTIHLDYDDVSSSNTTKPSTGAAIYTAISNAALAWEAIPSAGGGS